MKTLLVLLGMVVLQLALSSKPSIIDEDGTLIDESTDLDQEYTKFSKAFGKSNKVFSKIFKNGPNRKEVFAQNVKKLLEEAKKDQGTVQFGVNKYTDWTIEERDALNGDKPNLDMTKFVKKRKGSMGHARTKRQAPVFYGVPPLSVDWRALGGVTAVKEQGSCGSCWAHAAVGVVESQHKIKTKRDLDLSEQELVDCIGCTGTIGSCAGGCSGNNALNGLYYAYYWYGLQSEASYPYTATNGTCQAVETAERYDLSDYYMFGNYGSVYNQTELKAHIAEVGPITMAFSVPDSYYGLKGTGIWNPPKADCDAARFDRPGHEVLVVGYGTQDGLDYWLFKNSLGTTWGDQGFMKIARNSACIKIDRFFGGVLHGNWKK